MPPITDLRAMADEHMQRALAELRETATLNACYLVIADDGTDLFVADGASINDRDFKDALGKKLRARIAETNAYAYAMISDTFVARVAANDQQAMLKEKLRQRLGMTIEQAGKAGLLEVAEAITIRIETRVGRMAALVQEYLRDPADGSKIIIAAPPRYEEADQSPGIGRFFGMFAPAAPGSYHKES